LIGDDKYLKENIKGLNSRVHGADSGSCMGILSINTEKKLIPLITLIDEGDKFVKDDLAFLKQLFEDFMDDK